MHRHSAHRVQRIQIMPCKVLAFIAFRRLWNENFYSLQSVMQSFSMKVIGSLMPQITHPCLFLKARLGLTPDVTYVMPDYVTNLGSKTRMWTDMDHIVGLSEGSSVKMASGTGVPATTSTEKGRLGEKTEAGRSKIASSGMSSHKRE